MITTQTPSVAARLLRALVALALPALLALSGHGALAAFPDRPLKIIVPFPAGGGTDNWARLFARELGARLGQPIVVENKPGANTRIGAAGVATAAPDGYTLLFTSGTHVQLPALYPDLPYNVREDFAPIGRLGITGLVFVANPSVKAANMREFIDRARQDGKYNFASYAAGSAGAVFGQYMSESERLGMAIVAYKGEAPAITDVIAGVAQAGYFSIPTAKAFVKSGQVVALGVLSAARAASLPEVPTLVEQGMTAYDWPGVWIGVFAPGKTPQPVLDRLAAEMRALAQDPRLQKAYADLDLNLDQYKGPDEFRASIRTEMDLWSGLVTRLKIRGE